VNGHDVKAVTLALNVAKQADTPTLVHVLTVKGKGYDPAEKNPVYFHGVGKFSLDVGEGVAERTGGPPGYTEIFGSTLCGCAARDERIVAITAAMPEGTGLHDFSVRFPDRFIDVGICEQHAVTFAAGLATRGFKPVVAVYSTFLQRSYDQIVHDVCLQNLPVIFCIDRAGIVGEDGPTHHGVFDIAFLRHIPNMTLIAPRDEDDLRSVLVTALAGGGPCALRYPRGAGLGLPLSGEPRILRPGVMETLRRGESGAAVIAVGPIVHAALAAAAVCAEEGVSVSVNNARWIKPLPVEDILAVAKSHTALLLAEEGSLAGGFGSAVLECLAESGLSPLPRIRRLGLPDAFIPHGSAAFLRANYGLTAGNIADTIQEMLHIA
jgi:1-deoxy-D-xylulose-5-phosphate synthase